jgi:hypothetical protein
MLPAFHRVLFSPKNCFHVRRSNELTNMIKSLCVCVSVSVCVCVCVCEWVLCKNWMHTWLERKYFLRRAVAVLTWFIITQQKLFHCCYYKCKEIMLGSINGIADQKKIFPIWGFYWAQTIRKSHLNLSVEIWFQNFQSSSRFFS